jgi:hypothetical protein
MVEGAPRITPGRALLDKSSNRVWIEVMYPDRSGDDPGCLFPNIDRFSWSLDGVRPP